MVKALAKVTWEKGLRILLGGQKIGIDVRDVRDEDFLLISHAHADHIPKSCKGFVVCSNATKHLINISARRKLRENLSYVFSRGLEICMFPSGHIFGSASFLIKYGDFSLLYTGDFCDKRRFFMDPIDVDEILKYADGRIDQLVMESTYGDPYFTFPDFETTVNWCKDWIEDNLGKGYSTILIGNKIGKSQILTKLAEEFENVILSPEVERINNIYATKFNLQRFPTINEVCSVGKLKVPFILICPPTSKRWMRIFSRKYKVKKAIFSGFAVDKSFKILQDVDEAFPISDHPDFHSLVNFVSKVNPELTILVHGSSKRLASHLNEMGFNATFFEDGQRGLNEFLEST
ncbi:MAG: MBL fold metallo-hydrolase [Candidatus Nanoarchaeia archaeon]|nr:MBL fold metallo-hydrolase [Candidatus Haiyanarchaeum thermophilum]MCW1302981.1 MBL fold metallo-hydrolase [Candidatus Haiyanarchaeum thermophilum]MCW1303658.1 MBL fold metallo-hydrolase [Candidatus Haiyanarchaeum thermophilum]MCW1306339.1 MBL fold metallo-hydrolase [Candidatus Haiyanarchaeum thermophilum]MCW1307151.1 MBL fold metallo-hydrolase [Candidatus Haiyanarchaeum thermophilum]